MLHIPSVTSQGDGHPYRGSGSKDFLLRMWYLVLHNYRTAGKKVRTRTNQVS